MLYIAHKKEGKDGTMSIQAVKEHCRKTAAYAGDSLKSANLFYSGYLAGLLHDCGKYATQFQDYITSPNGQQRGSVIHTFQGCRYFLESYHDQEDPIRKLTAELLAYAVGAHHGLFDCVDKNGETGFFHRVKKEEIEYECTVERFFEDCSDREETNRLFSNAADEIRTFIRKADEYFPGEEFYFSVSLLVRMILSGVIEGDRRDTAEFMNGTCVRNWPKDMREIWGQRLNYLEAKLSLFPCATNIEQARRAISEQCRNSAKKEPDIYQLNVPTGAGKTLSSLRYALAHAARYNKQRIIFTSPLLSILEQNAKIIHDAVGCDALILEHHSNVVQAENDDDNLDERELLMESWDAPIIITTLVQLLNTMFSGKTTAIRRFHSLCDTVIVIDEVQSVPIKMLSLFNITIQFLSVFCGATVVLCSATQPAWKYAAHPLKKEPSQLVPYDAKLWRVFQRTNITPMGNARLQELLDMIREIMADTQSLLIVCNKKDEAAELFRRLGHGGWECFHLSAAMCMQHRRDTLEVLHESLRSGKKTLCISTQVIEAGVDISFQRVFRLAAGMDHVVQSAGRCNRNGESAESQPVYLVNCTDENLAKLVEIQAGKDATIALMATYKECPSRFGDSLMSERAVQYYYQMLYHNQKEGAQDYPLKDKPSIFELLTNNSIYMGRCRQKSDYLLCQAFKEAGHSFQVFENGSTDVLVPYGEGRRIIEELCSDRALRDTEYRVSLIKRAKPYVVALYDYQRKAMESHGALTWICDHTVLALQPDCYNLKIGLEATVYQNIYLEV